MRIPQPRNHGTNVAITAIATVLLVGYAGYYSAHAKKTLSMAHFQVM